MTDDQTYEVVIVKYGARSTSRHDVFLNYSVYAEPDGPIGMDYFLWVVRNGTRTVVVDTGFSLAAGSARNRDTLVDPPAAFHALDLGPSAEPTVIVTHAHYDHIGNLDHFDRSPVVIAQSELDFWEGPQGRQPVFHHSVEDSELATLARARSDGRLVVFDERHTVAPGIEVVRVGGHTPGQAVVLVQTAAGTVLLASDAVHYYEELERRMPFSLAANLVQMFAGFEWISQALATGVADHLVTGHDPATLDRFAAGDPNLPFRTAVIG